MMFLQLKFISKCPYSYHYSSLWNQQYRSKFREMLPSRMYSRSFLRRSLNLCTEIRPTERKSRTIFDKSFSIEKKLRQQDGLSPDFELIYRLPDAWWYRISGLFSYFTFIAAPCFLLYNSLKDQSKSIVKSAEVLKSIAADPFLLMNTETYYFMATLLIIVSGWHYLYSKRHVLRIYHDGEKYVAVFMHPFLPGTRTTNHIFTSATKYQGIPSISARPTYLLGRRKSKLVLNSFKRPADFYLMTCEDRADEDDQNDD